MPSWLALFAPVGTPAPVIARINETVRMILLDPPIKERLATLGLIVAPGTPGELSELIKQGLAVRGDLIKAANIKPE
jgi:tripartite-type tricarboxylate transporter receptor subunit TctC